MHKWPEQVVDDLGGVHRLEEKPLGQGGQGVVFRTRTNPHLVVKLLPRKMTWLRQRLADVHTLPVAEDVQIARPLALLKDRNGYTMSLMQDMVPIKELIHTPQDGALAAFYVATGSLYKRLRVLANAARTLARLHAMPVVYGDVSHNNVFISEDADEHQVWLIDADNLTFARTDGTSVYTPGFGAPEVVAGRPASTLSDAYAFAVLAHQVLAQHHPFLGPMAEGGWEDDGEDAEQQAFAGALPWVHDADDDRNRVEHGIPPELVFSPRIRALFQETFGVGRKRPTARAGMLAWAEVLQTAADRVVRCQECGSSYYLERTCPWCDAAHPPFMRVAAYRWIPDEADAEIKVPMRPVWRKDFNLRFGTPEAIGSYIVRPTLFSQKEVPALAVELERDGIRLTPLDEGTYIWRHSDRIKDLVGPIHVPIPTADDPWFVHCGELDQSHRYLTFRAFAPR